MITFKPILPRRENLSTTEISLLVQRGWRSVSNKFKMIARLPEGETGIEACRRRRTLNECWSEETAASYYMRVHSEDEGNCLELDDASYRAFRRMGGRAA